MNNLILSAVATALVVAVSFVTGVGEAQAPQMASHLTQKEQVQIYTQVMDVMIAEK